MVATTAAAPTKSRAPDGRDAGHRTERPALPERRETADGIEVPRATASSSSRVTPTTLCSQGTRNLIDGERQDRYRYEATSLRAPARGDCTAEDERQR